MNKPAFSTCNEITQSLGVDLLATVISCLITALLSMKKMNRHGLHLRAWGPKYLGYNCVDFFICKKSKRKQKKVNEEVLLQI